MSDGNTTNQSSINANLEENLAITRKAIFVDPITISNVADKVFGVATREMILQIAAARHQLGEFRGVLGEAQNQDIGAIAMLSKALNDILLGYHIIRSGYNKRAIFNIRIALESIAQAYLIFRDSGYFLQFQRDKTRADQSIIKLAEHLPIGLNSKAETYIAWLCTRKVPMNLYSHSSVYAALADTVQHQTTFGPSWDNSKIDELNKIIFEFGEMASLVNVLAEWMMRQRIPSAPARNRS